MNFVNITLVCLWLLVAFCLIFVSATKTDFPFDFDSMKNDNSFVWLSFVTSLGVIGAVLGFVTGMYKVYADSCDKQAQREHEKATQIREHEFKEWECFLNAVCKQIKVKEINGDLSITAD